MPATKKSSSKIDETRKETIAEFKHLVNMTPG